MVTEQGAERRARERRQETGDASDTVRRNNGGRNKIERMTEPPISRNRWRGKPLQKKARGAPVSIQAQGGRAAVGLETGDGWTQKHH